MSATREPVVYVVDGDGAARGALQELFESVRLPVTAFESPAEFMAAHPEPMGCLVTDLHLPGMSGFELQQRISEGGHNVLVVVLTALGDVPSAVRAMKAGAYDFLQKPWSPPLLLDVVCRALDLVKAAEKERIVVEGIRDHYLRLTGREQEVFKLLVDGRTSKQIAAELEISPKTIEAHRTRVLDKMGVEGVPGLIRLAFQMHIGEFPDLLRKPLMRCPNGQADADARWWAGVRTPRPTLP